MRSKSFFWIATFLLLCLIFAAQSSSAAEQEANPLKKELSRLLKLKTQLKQKWNPRRYLNDRILRIAKRFRIVIPQRCKRRVIVDDEVVDIIRKLAECDRETKPELPPTTPSNPPTTPTTPTTPTKPEEPKPSVPTTPTTPSNPSVPPTPTLPKCPQRLTCRKLCKNGYYFDENGCVDTCRCKPASCPQFKCLRACPYGYKVNSRGCTTCDCKPKPTTEVPSTPTTPTQPTTPTTPTTPTQPTTPTTPTTPTEPGKPTFECPKRKCARICVHGYKTDRRGCQTCACVRKSIRPPRPPVVRPPRPPVRPPVTPDRPVVRPPVVRPPPRPPVVRPPVVRPPVVRPPRVIRPPVVVRPPIARPRRRRRFFGRGRGDPHYTLLETGKDVLFNGLGDYILAETQDKEFAAHVRIGKWHKKATVNIGAAVKLGNDVVEFDSKDGQFYLNKEEAEFKIGKKYELEGGYLIRKSENRFVVKSIDGVEFFGERFTLHDGKSYMDVQVDSPKDVEFRRGLIVNGKGRQGKGLFRSVKVAKVNKNAVAVVEIPKWAKKACAKQGLTGKQLKDCAYDITLTGKEFAKEIAKDEAKFAKKGNKVLKAAAKKK